VWKCYGNLQRDVGESVKKSWAADIADWMTRGAVWWISVGFRGFFSETAGLSIGRFESRRRELLLYVFHGETKK